MYLRSLASELSDFVGIHWDTRKLQRNRSLLNSILTESAMPTWQFQLPWVF